jgi:hypothetical protein
MQTTTYKYQEQGVTLVKPWGTCNFPAGLNNRVSLLDYTSQAETAAVGTSTCHDQQHTTWLLHAIAKHGAYAAEHLLLPPRLNLP